MPKINQEEYEVLKELDDEWKWIARDKDKSLWVFTEKPVREYGPSRYWWDVETEEPFSALELIDEIHLFQFIQWEDESPYNIAELIEEYEEHEFYNYVGWKYYKKGKAEVKNIEWLKKEVNELPLRFLGFSMLKQREEFTVSKDDVLELINQLDEPEVLSQKWIDEHRETTFDLDEDFETVFIKVEKLQNLLVPKQELPVIPKFVAEYIREGKELGCDLGTAMTVETEVLKDIRDYIKNNEDTFARAWLDGCEVEEEQKYYVDLETAAYVAKWDGNGQVDIYTDGISGSDEYEFHLTEKEIKDYDDRFWPFAVNVKELEE